MLGDALSYLRRPVDSYVTGRGDNGQRVLLINLLGDGFAAINAGGE